MKTKFKVGDIVIAIPEECKKLGFSYPSTKVKIKAIEKIDHDIWYVYDGNGRELPASCLENYHEYKKKLNITKEIKDWLG